MNYDNALLIGQQQTFGVYGELSLASPTDDTQPNLVTPTAARKYDTLIDMLRNSRSNASIHHTHVLVGPPYGTFSIGGNNMKQFWELYATELAKDQNAIYVAETPGKELPVLVDVDLKLKKNAMVAARLDRLYTDDQLVALIKGYQTIIAKIVDGLRPESLTCVVLEKNMYEQTQNGTTYVKNGFHLHFPKLFLDKNVQEIYLIPLVKLEVSHMFENIGIADCIDANSINVHWLMYGSRKPNNAPYVATRCFLANGVEVSVVDGLKDYKLNSFKNETNLGATNAGNVVERLPRILSIFMYGRDTCYYYRPKHSVNTPVMDSFSERKATRSRYDQVTISEALETAGQLMPLLSHKRADVRSDWLAVGFCIWNISGGDDEGLSMWLEFSELSDKFDEVECISLWSKMRTNQYTLGTLKFFAKQDSPDEYEELLRGQRQKLTTKMIDGSHNDIAHMLHNEYGNEFVCADVGSNVWYQFRNHMWHESDKGLDLRERISAHTGCVIKTLYDKLNELRYDDNNVEDEKTAKKNIDTVSKIIKSCKSAPFKNCVMIECVEVFRNNMFLPLLNKDPHLVAFKNGVYDFQTGTFRPGKPEDYLSVSLPLEYYDYGSVEHPRVAEIDDFFTKIFPDPAVREYFLYHVSHTFIGGNHHKIMMFWTGSGENGKSVTSDFFAQMLGPLAVKFSSALITGKKSNLGSAAPELARAGNGVRWGVMDEPNQDELINAGMLKSLTGNDSYWARDLFEKGKSTKETKPLFKLHMICNKLPGIRYADEATWNRIKVIPFESTFLPIDQCSNDLDAQIATKRFPKDGTLTDRLRYMTQPLAWYLINRWQKSANYKPIEPNKVKVATSAFRRENDIYKQFREETIVVQHDHKLFLAAVYARYNDWFKVACPGQNLQPRAVIKEQLIEVIGPLTSDKYWDGFAFEDDVGQRQSEDRPASKLTRRVNPLLD